MLADYTFYHGTYKGIVFSDSGSYEYFGERASDKLALYSNMKVFSEDATAETQLKKCACRIADIIYSATLGGKTLKSGNVASESIAGYYSVNYGTMTEQQVNSQINTAIKLYIGKYFLGSKPVMW